jgi:hypothetical protein
MRELRAGTTSTRYAKKCGFFFIFVFLIPPPHTAYHSSTLCTYCIYSPCFLELSGGHASHGFENLIWTNFAGLTKLDGLATKAAKMAQQVENEL